MDIKQQRVVDGGTALPPLSTLPSTSILATTHPQQRMLRRWMPRCCLLALDAAMITIAFIAAYFTRYDVLNGVQFTTPFMEEQLSSFRELQLVVTIGMVLAFALKGLYGLRAAGNSFRAFWAIAAATTAAFAVFSAYDYLVRKTDVALDSRSRSLVIFAWLFIILFVSAARLLVSLGVTYLYGRGIGLTNLLVVGSGRLARLMMQQIAATPNLGYRVVGFVYDQESPSGDFGRFKALGELGDLERVLQQERIGEVILALPSQQREQILRAVASCEQAGAAFKLAPDIHELGMARFDIDTIEGIPLIGLKQSLTSTWRYRIKRAVDVVGASLLLIVGAPFWLLIALAVKLDSPGPVLYHQQRIGYRGARFTCLKFRSMDADAEALLDSIRDRSPADERGKFKLPNDPRRTMVGRFLRRTSLDEIPQLLCVLRGEMSLVGPRPPLVVEHERYEDWEKGRLEMRPGLTGLWQVRGRSDIDFDEMVLMDLYYIENWSLRLDFQILLRTIPAVLASRGAY